MFEAMITVRGCPPFMGYAITFKMAIPNIVFRFKNEVPDPEDRRKQAVTAFNQHPDKVPVSPG